MKSEENLNKEIIELSLTIQQKYPKLSDYLAEMTITIPNIEKPLIKIKNLNDYSDSLTSLFDNYIREHLPQE
jgi:hypothetical protein